MRDSNLRFAIAASTLLLALGFAIDGHADDSFDDPGAPRNLILMIADGAGFNSWKATAMYDGTLGELALRASDHDGLVLYIFRDEDKDGVSDDLDVCAATMLPEAVPTSELGTNRFAETDGDGVFNTVEPKGQGPRRSYDIHDTAGCSCEQIIEAQDLDDGHAKFGCSIGAMEDWTTLVQ